jgi:hypothetical protein
MLTHRLIGGRHFFDGLLSYHERVEARCRIRSVATSLSRMFSYTLNSELTGKNRNYARVDRTP